MNRMKNGFFHKLVLYVFFTCLFFSMHTPRYASAQTFIGCNPDCEPRNRAAYVIAGATIVGLGIAVGIIAAFSTGHGHCCSYGDCYSSCYSSYSSNHCHHHHSYSSDYSSFFSSDSSSSYGNDNNIVTDQLLNTQFPLRQRKLETNGLANEQKALSGSFIISPNQNIKGTGEATAYVRLPDGTEQILGCFSLSENGHQVLSYGPFDQEGPYDFGVKLERASELSPEAKICSLEIAVNDEKVDQFEFVARECLAIGQKEYTLSL